MMRISLTRVILHSDHSVRAQPSSFAYDILVANYYGWLQKDALAAECYFLVPECCRRCCVGVSPVDRRKMWLKWLRLAKPT